METLAHLVATHLNQNRAPFQHNSGSLEEIKSELEDSMGEAEFRKCIEQCESTKAQSLRLFRCGIHDSTFVTCRVVVSM